MSQTTEQCLKRRKATEQGGFSEKKSSESKKVVVVQPGWQYFKTKFKISLGTYNACYNRAVRKHKKLNPTKTTIPKKIIGNEIVKHTAASKEAGNEKFGTEVKFSSSKDVDNPNTKSKKPRWTADQKKEAKAKKSIVLPTPVLSVEPAAPVVIWDSLLSGNYGQVLRIIDKNYGLAG